MFQYQILESNLNINNNTKKIQEKYNIDEKMIIHFTLVIKHLDTTSHSRCEDILRRMHT